MKTILTTCLAFTVIFFYSCKSKPSEADISKKILLEYVCPDNAKINDLKILDAKKTESFLGLPAMQYTVSGEVEWASGCDEALKIYLPVIKKPLIIKQ